jgi:hypothetical protein
MKVEEDIDLNIVALIDGKQNFEEDSYSVQAVII